MKPQTYRSLAQRQQTYWWHRARRKTALALLRRYGLRQGGAWLDLGCGPGGNFSMLAPLSPSLIAGVDISEIALEYAREFAPRALLRQGDLNEPLPFEDGAFDLVTIFNVLYHEWVRSEADVFAEAARVLRPGGLLLFTEPAFEWLMRDMDEAVMTRRRYRDADFDPWLRAAGFQTLFSSYFTCFGVPILLASKLRKRSKGDSHEAIDMRPVPTIVDAGFTALARAEGWALAHGMRMPFGTTLIRVARRTFTPNRPNDAGEAGESGVFRRDGFAR